MTMAALNDIDKILPTGDICVLMLTTESWKCTLRDSFVYPSLPLYITIYTCVFYTQVASFAIRQQIYTLSSTYSTWIYRLILYIVRILSFNDAPSLLISPAPQMRLLAKTARMLRQQSHSLRRLWGLYKSSPRPFRGCILAALSATGFYRSEQSPFIRVRWDSRNNPEKQP